MTKVELRNRKGEPNGKFRYEISDAKLVIETRVSRNNYISAGRLHLADGTSCGWVYSSKVFANAGAVAAQMGCGPRHMSPGKYGWGTAAGRHQQRLAYRRWFTENVTGADIVLLGVA